MTNLFIRGLDKELTKHLGNLGMKCVNNKNVK